MQMMTHHEAGSWNFLTSFRSNIFSLKSGIVLDLIAKSVAFLDMEYLTDNFGIRRKVEGPAASACFAIWVVCRMHGSLKLSWSRVPHVHLPPTMDPSPQSWGMRIVFKIKWIDIYMSAVSNMDNAEDSYQGKGHISCHPDARLCCVTSVSQTWLYNFTD